MRRVLLPFIMVSLAFSPAPLARRAKADPLRADLKAMQGAWALDKAIEDGRVVPAAALREAGMAVSLEVAGKQWTHVARDTRTLDEERTKLTVRKVEAPKSPKQILLAGENGDVACTYRLDGDTLTIRLSAEENEVLVFKRKAP